MDGRRLRSIAMIAIFDIAGPLLAYNLLSSHGFSTVTSLVLSGVFPAAGVMIGIIAHRRVDTVGVLVLGGIALGTALGLASHNPRLVLDEGSVTTAAFGLVCLGSLATARPLMYRLVLEFTGPDTPRGREFADFWQHEGFRHSFRAMTMVWGFGFLAEAVVRIIIVQDTSTGTALATSTALPLVVGGLLSAWTIGYGRYSGRKAERLAAATAARAGAADVHPAQ